MWSFYFILNFNLIGLLFDFQAASKVLAGMKLSQFGRLVANTTRELDNGKKETACECFTQVITYKCHNKT